MRCGHDRFGVRVVGYSRVGGIKGQVRDGVFRLRQEERSLIHLQDGTGSAFTAGVPGVAE